MQGIDNKRFEYLGFAALLFGVWLLATPYYGIRHDSILYTVQALKRLYPDNYGNDLLFKFGSQDSFTLFPVLHAWAIRLLGIDYAALCLSAAGKLLWFAGLVFLARAFLGGIPFWLGLAVAISYSPYYDSYHAFSYGESFATARIFAEALVFAALGLCLKGRRLMGAGALALAAAVHPLLALPGIALAFLLHRWKSVASLMAIGVGLSGLVLVLAVSGVSPFSRLLAQFDPAWLEIVVRRNVYVFLDAWDVDAFGRIAYLATILLTARRRSSGVVGELAEALLWLAGIMLFTSWLGTTVFQNVLITQLQLWRALWLIQVLALLMLGGVTPVLWAGPGAQRMLLVALWSAALLPGTGAGTMVIAGFALSEILDRYAPDWKPTRAMVVVGMLVVGFALFWKLLSIRYLITAWRFLFDRPAWQVVLSDIVVVAPLTAALLWCDGHCSRRTASWMVSLWGALALLVGVAMWSGRSANTQMWSAPILTTEAARLQALIPKDATVFWPDGVERTWFWLLRSHYASNVQSVGALFSRQTAVESAGRQARLLAMGFEEGNPYWGRNTASIIDNREVRRRIDAPTARALCQDPALDYVIAPAGMPLASISTFADPFGRGSMTMVDCRTLRD